MSDNGSTDGQDPEPPPRRPYNRPRRYPVPSASAAAPNAPDAPDAPAEVTRQNPTLAAAAQDYEQRFGPLADAPTAPLPSTAPLPPTHYPAATESGHTRTVSRRTVLVGVAVLAAIAVVGLVLGLSGGSDDPRPGAGQATATPSTPASSVAPGGTASTAVPAPQSASTSPAPTAPGLPGGDGSPAGLCARLGATAPFTTLVSSLRPAGRMPESYVEPQAGTRIAVCVGAFRSGAGAGRGRVAYVAEYTRLPATQYAAQLRTLNWIPDPTLPRSTYRNNLTTTVTLVPQGTALVTVVGTGR